MLFSVLPKNGVVLKKIYSFFTSIIIVVSLYEISCPLLTQSIMVSYIAQRLAVAWKLLEVALVVSHLGNILEFLFLSLVF